MAVIAPIIIPVIVRHQRRIIEALQAAGALDRTRAVAIEKLGVHEGQALRTLRRHEIVCDAGDGRVWLDEAAWNAHQSERTRLAVGIAAGMAVLVGGSLIALWLALH